MSARRPTRFEGAALGAGIMGMAGCLLGLVGDRFALALSYLAAYLFWSGVSIGALALLMIHRLTGGAWGDAIQRPLNAAIRALPLAALLFVPIALGLSSLYVWARPDALAASTLLQHKSWYLNPPFFLLRSAIYFAVWIGLGVRLARQPDDTRSADRALGRWSAGGLVLYGLTTTFAAVDWLMALLPEWYSTIFGLLVGVGDALSALAFAIVVAIALPGVEERVAPRVRRDLGNFLLMLVLVWSYLAFMEYLTIWVGNQPHAISWYVPRVQTPWRWLGLFLVLFHFAVPFALLLSRRVKGSTPALCGVAALMLVAHWADSIWMVIPSIDTRGLTLRWSDAAALVGIGGLWLAVVAWQWRAIGWPAAPAAASTRGKRHG